MRAERTLTAEAALLIAVVRVCFRIASYATTRRWLTSTVGARRGSLSDTAPVPARVGAAVRAAGRRLRGTTCLVEALTAELMLRRRGLASTLHIGVRAPASSTPLDAHAWLDCDGVTVIGDRADFTEYRILG